MSAIDLVERVEFFVGSTSVVNTTTAKSRMLANILMKNELSHDGWFKYVGKNLVGWNSYEINSTSATNAGGVPAHAGERHYQVPLWCLHPALQTGNLPCGYAKEDTGTITFEEYTNQNGSYPPFAPIAVSLERTEIDDTDQTVVNRGLSAFDFGVDGDVQTQLKLSSALAAGEELYSALVYEKALVMRDGAITVEA